jgi:predicted Zn finger-like uncharacterized protein
MLIACPTCAASYEVDASLIGAAGRSVRCVRCRAIWFAAPPEQVPPLASAAAASDEAVEAFKTELGGAAADQSDAAPPDDAEVAGAAVADIETAAAAASVADDHVPLEADATAAPAAAEEQPPDAPQPAPGGDRLAGRPARHRTRDDDAASSRQRPRPGARRAASAAKPHYAQVGVILGLVAVLGGLLGWRVEVVRHVPQLASLYAAIGLPVNLRKLAFTDVRLTREVHDGVPIFVVDGMIASAAAVALDVPRLRFSVRNAAGAEIYHWTALPSQPKIGPYEALPFRSKLASPPADGRDIVVRFFNRRDAVANLR